MADTQPQTLLMDTDKTDLEAAGWTHCPEELSLKWRHPNGGKFSETEALKIVAQGLAKQKLHEAIFEAGFDRMQDGHWRCPDMSVTTEKAAVALFLASKNGTTEEPSQAESEDGEPMESRVPRRSSGPSNDSLGEIFITQMEVRHKQAKVEECKEKLKAAKADEELAVQKLMEAIDQAKQADSPTLFDRPAETTESAESFEQTGTKESTDSGECPPDESWRALPLSEVLVGIPDSNLEKLADAKLDTLGQLSDWLKDERNRLTDLPGIGQAKAEKIENKLMEFWERWNQRSQGTEHEECPATLPFADSNGTAQANEVQD